VIAAIGEGVAAVRGSESSVSLDVARTAAAQITHAVPTAKIAVSAINTVTDLRFHSHRRDRQNAGRGLGFFRV
jgi:copper oxidase (laccase) domain-containing protein